MHWTGKFRRSDINPERLNDGSSLISEIGDDKKKKVGFCFKGMVAHAMDGLPQLNGLEGPIIQQCLRRYLAIQSEYPKLHEELNVLEVWLIKNEFESPELAIKTLVETVGKYAELV